MRDGRLTRSRAHGGTWKAILVAAALVLAPTSGLWAQAGQGHAAHVASEGDRRGGAQEMDMAGGRMVMPTDDGKSFRLVRPAVAALQAKLAVLGLFEGRINGLYGPTTRAAVMTYQRQHRLEPTGLPDSRTTLSLRGLSPEPAERAGPDQPRRAPALSTQRPLSQPRRSIR